MVENMFRGFFKSFNQYEVSKVNRLQDEKDAVSLSILKWMVFIECLLVFFHPITMPLWIYILALICLVWRIGFAFQYWKLPSSWIKRLLVISVCILVAVSFQWSFSLNSAVALFISAFVLKILEIRTIKDGYFFCFLAIFLTCARFLFDSSIPSAVIGGLCILLCITILVSLNLPFSRWYNIDGLKISGKMLLQSLPMMVLLFIFFPRLPPLWSLKINSQSYSTGLSESMTPGEISNLAQSDQVAFRASFEDATSIPSNQLYWRALTLTLFDGKTWLPEIMLNKEQEIISQGGNVGLEKGDRSLNYTVLVEPTSKKQLYALEFPDNVRGAQLNKQLQVSSVDPIYKRFQYEVVSYPEAKWKPMLTDEQKALYTSLPKTGNKDSHRLVQALWQNTETREQYMNSVLVYFREKGFVYTLKPPSLHQNHIDQFLFESRAGFCAHYASAFTFMMRSAGIPARVVLGYQGGEYNQSGNYYTVRQLDAHAWVEVWDETQGWIRVDPTAAVSPQRIELGSYDVLRRDVNFLASSPYSALQLKEMEWLNSVRLEIEFLNFMWNSWVVNYNMKQQYELFENLLGRHHQILSLLMMSGLAGTILVLLSWFLLRTKQQNLFSDTEKVYLSVCVKLKKLGYSHRQSNESAQNYFDRIHHEFESREERELFQQFTELFLLSNYAQQSGDVRKRSSSAKLRKASLTLMRNLRRRRPITKASITHHT